jgi:hypothetical protein
MQSLIVWIKGKKQTFGTTSPRNNRQQAFKVNQQCIKFYMHNFKSAYHVFPIPWIALDHLMTGFKALKEDNQIYCNFFSNFVGDFGHMHMLMECLLGGNDGCIGGQREVDSGIWDQIGLELGQIHVQRTIKAERGFKVYIYYHIRG